MDNNRSAIKSRIWILVFMSATFLSIPFLVPHCGFFALFALVPLFFIDKICYDNNIKHTWWYYFTAFFLFNLAATFWIYYVSPIGSVAALLLNTLQMSVIFALFRWSKKRVKGILPYLFFIATWLAWEHVYYEIEISWPWLVLGNSFAASVKLVQWYDITGVLGGTLWILLSNVLLYFVIINLKGSKPAGKYQKRGRYALLSTFAIVLIVPMVYSLFKYYGYKEEGDSVEVVVVQPNIDPFTEKFGKVSQRVQDYKLLSLVDKVITPDTRYIFTPETFTYRLDLDYPEGNGTYMTFKDYTNKHPKVNFVFGALAYKNFYTSIKPSVTARSVGEYWYEVYNSAIIIDKDDIYQYYHKSKLVPGVERIPYQKQLTFLGDIFAKFGGAQDSYATQKELSIMRGNDGNNFGVMICYESIYGDYSREAVDLGANFMAVMTNDGWWGDTPGYRQHFRFASLRAIEMRRDIVHATNTGTSGFINQRGDILQKTDWWVPVAIKENVHLNSEKTIFVKYGDVIGRVSSFLFCLLMLSLIGISFIYKRKR